MITADLAARRNAASSVLDNGGLADLKRLARSGDPAANKEVAKQFEALFMQMVLKSMRDAIPREGLFDSQASRLYESLHDQQLSLTLGGDKRGLGLAAMIEKQLVRQNSLPAVSLGPLPLRTEPSAFPLDAARSRPPPDTTMPFSAPLKVAPSAGNRTPTEVQTSAPDAVGPGPQAFVDRVLPAAQAAERRIGIPAHFLVAQAALETGWGRSEPIRSDGTSTFNVFGIKAGAGWNGPSVATSTTEIIAGLAQSRVERFRAYGSYEEAFQDYASLLAASPRYSTVLGARDPQQFARGLQAAGYATDPLYASKLERIISGSTLRQTVVG